MHTSWQLLVLNAFFWLLVKIYFLNSRLYMYVKDTGRKFSLSIQHSVALTVAVNRRDHSRALISERWRGVGQRRAGGCTVTPGDRGGCGMALPSFCYSFSDEQFCSSVGIYFPDSLLALIPFWALEVFPKARPWSSACLYLCSLLLGGSEHPWPQQRLQCRCISVYVCSPKLSFSLVKCLRDFPLGWPIISLKTPLPDLKTQTSSSLPPSWTAFPLIGPFFDPPPSSVRVPPIFFLPETPMSFWLF